MASCHLFLFSLTGGECAILLGVLIALIVAALNSGIDDFVEFEYIFCPHGAVVATYSLFRFFSIVAHLVFFPDWRGCSLAVVGVSVPRDPKAPPGLAAFGEEFFTDGGFDHLHAVVKVFTNKPFRVGIRTSDGTMVTGKIFNAKGVQNPSFMIRREFQGFQVFATDTGGFEIPVSLESTEATHLPGMLDPSVSFHIVYWRHERRAPAVIRRFLSALGWKA